MSDIELVIKISEEDYKRGIAMASAIRNGIPLPKGHGRLIDADKLISSFPNYDGVSDVIKTINYTDTIIDADKESEE